jgi:hypothetical protein
MQLDTTTDIRTVRDRNRCCIPSIAAVTGCIRLILGIKEIHQPQVSSVQFLESM